MKVRLLNVPWPEWTRPTTRQIAESLPYFQRDGHGYVHMVRSANMHYTRPENGSFHTHTSFTFWCGGHGFIYPSGKENRRHVPASILAEPSQGRVVCATCEGRAIGSGQVGNGRVREDFVKYRPHHEFHATHRKQAKAAEERLG